MKKILFTLVALMGLTFAFSSCSKKDEPKKEEVWQFIGKSYDTLKFNDDDSNGVGNFWFSAKFISNNIVSIRYNSFYLGLDGSNSKLTTIVTKYQYEYKSSEKRGKLLKLLEANVVVANGDKFTHKKVEVNKIEKSLVNQNIVFNANFREFDLKDGDNRLHFRLSSDKK